MINEITMIKFCEIKLIKFFNSLLIFEVIKATIVKTIIATLHHLINT